MFHNPDQLLIDLRLNPVTAASCPGRFCDCIVLLSFLLFSFLLFFLLLPPARCAGLHSFGFCGEIEPLLHKIFHQQQQITTEVRRGESGSRHAQRRPGQCGPVWLLPRNALFFCLRAAQLRKPHDTEIIPLMMHQAPSGIHCLNGDDYSCSLP